MNSSCAGEQLDLFVKKRLEPEEELEFLLHLDHCTRCQERVYTARYELYAKGIFRSNNLAEPAAETEED